jgi:Tol biopolymer transport system component
VAPRSAVVSPDGRAVYYREAVNREFVSIVKRDLASGDKKELVRSKYLVVGMPLSPDGRYVAALTSEESSGNPTSLKLIPTAGGETRELVRASGFTGVNFSPDGRYIEAALADTATKSRVVLLISIEDGRQQEVMRTPDNVPLNLAMWAPDSRSVILKSGTADRSELWKAPIDGSKAQKLDAPADQTTVPFFLSSDGRHVAIAAQPLRTEKKPPEIWVTENLFAVATTKR